MSEHPLLLLADLGGTNTRVALSHGPTIMEDSIRRFRNAEYVARGQDITRILEDYLGDAKVAVDGVCVAVAGPVVDGVAEMTNLSWTITRDGLAKSAGTENVAILNDLQAQGFALGHIAASDLNEVMPAPTGEGTITKGPMLVVGLGTGVNAAPVHGTGATRVVPPSECGHIDMPVRDEEGLRLMRFVEAQLAARGENPHCGVEEVLAGRGMGMLFSFVAAETGDSRQLGSTEVMSALANGDPLAREAARLYTNILAHFLADQALVHLPYGGICLIGGMARAIAPHLAENGFEATFREARRIDLLTEAFSVQVIEDDYAALMGCAHHLNSRAG